MILSDRSIEKKIKTGAISIDPFIKANLQPASYDLTLGDKALVFDTENYSEIDVRKPIEPLIIEKKITKDGFVVHPGDFILGNIAEVTGVDEKHVGRLEGKSSLGRIGIIIHATAGFLDPGNSLRMTLEISNLGNLPIRLYPGMKVAQIAFEEIDTPSKRPYGSKKLGSKYYGDMEVSASKMDKNF